MPRSGGVALRAVAITLVVASLLIVVALTAGSVPDGSAGARGWRIDRAAVAAVMRQALFVVYLAVLAHAFYLWLTQRDRPGRWGFRRSGTPALAVFLLLLLLLFLAMFRLLTLEEEIAPGEEGTGPTFSTFSPQFGGGGAPLPGGAGDSASPVPGWPVLAAGLALAGIVVAAVVARRRPAPDASELRTPSPPEAVTGRREVQAPPPNDARERVFVAYQRVEDAAGRTGRHRHPSETVTAHLRRLAAPEPKAAGRLISLYNRARFSSHVIDLEDASRAEQAGDEIRRRLR